MKKNILFINPPSLPFEDIVAGFTSESLRTQPVSMPLGILYLSACVKRYNQVGSVEILDYALKINEIAKYKNIEDFIIKIAQRDVRSVPDILAFSLIFSTSHRFFEVCVNILKTLWPNAVLIVGGTHATNSAKYLLDNKNVDFVARGEGEEAFYEFVRQYSELGYVDIKGIYSKEKIESAAYLDLCDYAHDLDSLPFPDWELIDMGAYITAKGRKREIGSSAGKRIASLMTTRGCPFQCTFCSSHTVHGRKMRFRSVENVIEEVETLHKRFGIKLFIPEDDLFTANQNRVINLLTALENLGIPDFELQFPSALSVSTLNEKVMDALIRAGTKIINIAIESGSEYVQKHIIRKNCDLQKAKWIVAYLKSKGIMIRCYFIFGFPLETKEQMMETVEYAKSLKADWAVFSIAIPLVGSEMYDQFIQMGYITNESDVWSKSFFQRRMFDTKEISANELEELTYRVNLDCNFINNPNKINGKYDVAIEFYKEIVSAYPFHIIAFYCLWECYEALGNFKESEQVNKRIYDLVKTDKRAHDMFVKYNDLMPKIEKNKVLMQ